MIHLTFQEALKKAQDYQTSKDSQPHLLLGNGFSIAWSPNIFSYDNLLKQADSKMDFDNLSPAVRKAFDMLNTSDFEVIIKLLKDAFQVLKLYDNMSLEFLETIKSDAELLKNILVETISKNHPENPSEISDEQYQACQKFLSNFQSIYTVNYDLLLYWTIIHNMNDIKFKDGFEDPVAQTSFWDSKAKKINFVNPCIIEELSKYITKDSCILEYGCGYGRILADLFENGYTNLHGVDFSEEMLQRGHSQYPQLDLKLNDGYKISFPDNSADAVLLFTVLTCIATDADQLAVMAEIKRVLKPNGILYLSDFLLGQDEKNLSRYTVFKEKYGTYGVFELEGGGVCRHHTVDWINQLLAHFDQVWHKENDIPMLTGNTSKPFQVIARIDKSIFRKSS
jgi:SAM-dependent methyltransferase